jgi:hypothetical protein
MTTERELDHIETILANLLVAERTSASLLDSLIDILLAKGYLDLSDMEIINNDIKQSLTETISDLE